MHVYLIVDEAHVGDAVGFLVRVGIDWIGGFVPPEVLHGLEALVPIEEIDMDEMERRHAEVNTAVLDVRQQDEYCAGHVPGAHFALHVRLAEVIYVNGNFSELEQAQERPLRSQSMSAGHRGERPHGFLEGALHALPRRGVVDLRRPSGGRREVGRG